jgi:hypothetical protein
MKPDTSEIADSDHGSKEESSSKEEDQYPHGLKLAAIILANMLAMFLVALVSPRNYVVHLTRRV